jgi:hypothetical protein
MSKRFYYDGLGEDIYDEQIDDYPSNQTICETLNKQDQRIAELDEKLENLEDLNVKFIEIANEFAERNKKLEEQLKNAIVPKFEYGQVVWCVYPTNEHRQGFVFELEFVGYTKDKIICSITENEEFEYDEVFATKEEAQAKLKELQGE